MYIKIFIFCYESLQENIGVLRKKSSVCRRNNAITKTYRRKKSSKISLRKFIFRRNSVEETKFRGNSEDTKFVGRFLGIYRGTPSSEYFDGIPMVQSSEVSTKYSSECLSGNSEELLSIGKFRGISVPRKIPRNFLPSENSEGNKFLGIFRGTSFPRNFQKINFLKN